jgi:hypothetical protein
VVVVADFQNFGIGVSAAMQSLLTFSTGCSGAGNSSSLLLHLVP